MPEKMIPEKNYISCFSFRPPIRKSATMIKTIKIYGLCCTCNHRCDCLSLRNSHREGIPILYCEEFDNFVAEAGGIRLRKKAKKMFVQSSWSNQVHALKLGLDVQAV
jgi:hypothetical protein